jgi:hypothetical protein
MKKTTYRQCYLRNRDRFQTSWIPAEFAEVGMILKIKDDCDQWENGWVVEAAYSESEELPDIRKAIRGHRTRTGDALPKRPPK